MSGRGRQAVRMTCTRVLVGKEQETLILLLILGTGGKREGQSRSNRGRERRMEYEVFDHPCFSRPPGAKEVLCTGL